MPESEKHFMTLQDFPYPEPGTSPNVPKILETLKKNPKAMEIFLDELEIHDRTQPKNRKIFAPSPTDYNVSPFKSRSGFETVKVRTVKRNGTSFQVRDYESPEPLRPADRRFSQSIVS